MGNIKYKADDSTEAANIPEQSNVDRAAFFLGVNKVDFVRLVMINCSPFSGYLQLYLFRALTSKTIRVHGETVTSAINSQQSRDVRDAFSKGIYGRLFIHIVKVIAIH